MLSRKRKKEPPDARFPPSASLFVMRSAGDPAMSLGHSQRDLQPVSFPCSWIHLYSSMFQTELPVPNPCACDALVWSIRWNSSTLTTVHIIQCREPKSVIVERICQEGQICSICVASICSLVRGPSQPVVGIQRTIWWFMLLLPSTTIQAGLSVQISGLSSAMVECICRDGHICVVGIASFEWLFRGPAQPVEQICVGALFHPDMGSCAVSYLFQIAVFKAETQILECLCPAACWHLLVLQKFGDEVKGRFTLAYEDRFPEANLNSSFLHVLRSDMRRVASKRQWENRLLGQQTFRQVLVGLFLLNRMHCFRFLFVQDVNVNWCYECINFLLPICNICTGRIVAQPYSMPGPCLLALEWHRKMLGYALEGLGFHWCLDSCIVALCFFYCWPLVLMQMIWKELPQLMVKPFCDLFIPILRLEYLAKGAVVQFRMMRTPSFDLQFVHLYLLMYCSHRTVLEYVICITDYTVSSTSGCKYFIVDSCIRYFVSDSEQHLRVLGPCLVALDTHLRMLGQACASFYFSYYVDALGWNVLFSLRVV